MGSRDRGRGEIVGSTIMSDIKGDREVQTAKGFKQISGQRL